MRRWVFAVVGGTAVVAIALAVRWHHELEREVIQWDQAKEIVSRSIERDGDTWHVALDSIVDKPAYQVWEAMKQPERSAEFVDAFRKSELLEEKDGRKVVRMQVQVLTLPTIAFDAEFRFDDAARKASMKTIGTPPQEIAANYEVVASPDDTRALVRYRGEVTNHIRLPLAESVQRGAIEEMFVKTVRAIHAGIDATEKKALEEAGRWKDAPEVAGAAIEPSGDGWKASFRSEVAAPVDKTWSALERPHDWAGSSPALAAIDVEKDDPSAKVLRLRGSLLALPPETWRTEIAYDAAAKSARLKTIGSPFLDLDATIRLEPSANGGTIVRYDAVATRRVKVPPPSEVQKGALCQLFAETVRALGRLS